MLGDPRFARASYVLFAVAVLAALLKLGGTTGAKPVVLQTAPATPAAAVERPAAPPGEDRVPDGPLLDWPEGGDPGKRALGELIEGQEGQAGVVDDAPVFRRPSPDGAMAEPVCGDLGDFPESSRAVFPLPDDYFGSYEPGWGSPRPQGGHEGTDLMSPTGTPEFAVTDGTIVEVAGANENGWNRLGGYTVMLEAAYDVGPIRKGDLFYYAHMDREGTLPIGAEVRAGQQIGSVGDTGEGPEVTRGKFPAHLHLGWYDAGGAGSRSEVESGAMDPYPLLLWLEENGGAVSGGTDASYCEAPQGPVPGPAPDSPGVRPDMDTGDARDARPSPVAGQSERRNGPPTDEDGQKKNGGRAGRSAPDASKASGRKTSAPDKPQMSGPQNDPNHTARPVQDEETRGGEENAQEDPGTSSPRPHRAPLPAPDPPAETTTPDHREDHEAREEDRDAPKAGDPERDDDPERDNEEERGERPDPERPEARPEPQSADEPAEPQPVPDEHVPDEQDPENGDAAREEDRKTESEPADAPEDAPPEEPAQLEDLPPSDPGEAEEADGPRHDVP